MNNRILDLALAQVNEIARHVASGNEAMAQDARRTLNELCWSQQGYPPPVRKALKARGLKGGECCAEHAYDSCEHDC